MSELPLNKIKTSARNPRKNFDEKTLKELAESIKANGVIEPIIVRRNGSAETYEIIAGERRFRAAVRAGLVTIPAVVRDESDAGALKIAIIENLQRENISFMDEARAVGTLREELSLDVREIVKILGKSEPWVYNHLTILKMDAAAIEAADAGEISRAVALEIAKLKPEHQPLAAANLSRKGTKVTLQKAQAWIREEFSGTTAKARIQKSALQKSGNDYQAIWKKYLADFSCQQFQEFKRLIRGRTETEIWAEAVDCVMRDAAVSTGE